MGLAAAGLVFFYPVALKFLGGNLVRYSSLRPELFLLAAAYVLLVPFWHAQNYMYAKDEGKLTMVLTIWAGVFGIAGLALLIWLFGVIGIYLGFILQMFLRMAFFRWAAHKRWHARLPWQGSLAGLLLASVGFVLSLRI